MKTNLSGGLQPQHFVPYEESVVVTKGWFSARVEVDMALYKVAEKPERALQQLSVNASSHQLVLNVLG